MPRSITDEDALEVCVQGSQKLLDENGELIRKIYRRQEDICEDRLG